MSKFPETRHEMKRAGYEFKSHATCKTPSCKAAIEWWKTTKGKMIPIDAVAPGTEHPEGVRVTPHWATCTRADEHREPKPAVTHRRELTLAEEQAKAMDLLATQLKARALVAVLADGNFLYSAKLGIAPEERRHDLITAANRVKNDLEAQHGS